MRLSSNAKFFPCLSPRHLAPFVIDTYLMSYVFTTSYNFESTAIDVILFTLSDTPELKEISSAPFFQGRKLKLPRGLMECECRGEIIIHILWFSVPRSLCCRLISRSCIKSCSCQILPHDLDLDCLTPQAAVDIIELNYTNVLFKQ